MTVTLCTGSVWPCSFSFCSTVCLTRSFLCGVCLYFALSSNACSARVDQRHRDLSPGQQGQGCGKHRHRAREAREEVHRWQIPWSIQTQQWKIPFKIKSKILLTKFKNKWKIPFKIHWQILFKRKKTIQPKEKEAELFFNLTI